MPSSRPLAPVKRRGLRIGSPGTTSQRWSLSGDVQGLACRKVFPMSRVPRRMAALAVTAPLFGLFAVTAPPAGAADGPVFTRTDLALDWLSDELDAHDGVLTVTFGTDVFPDQGLTIDAILAELAGGRGDD